jgi:hypothetical protein
MGSEGRCRKRFITEFEENLLAFAFLRGIMKIGMGAMWIPIRLPGKSESKLSGDYTKGKPAWPGGSFTSKPTWLNASGRSAALAFFYVAWDRQAVADTRVTPNGHLTRT